MNTTRHFDIPYKPVISANVEMFLNNLKTLTALDHVRIITREFHIELLSTPEKASDLNAYIKFIDYNGIPTDTIQLLYKVLMEDLEQSLDMFLRANNRSKFDPTIIDQLNGFRGFAVDTGKQFDLEDDFNDKSQFYLTINSQSKNHTLDWEYLAAIFNGYQMAYFNRAINARRRLWANISQSIQDRIDSVKDAFDQNIKLPSANYIPATTLVQILDILRFTKIIGDDDDMNVLEVQVASRLGIEKLSYQKARSAYLNNRNIKKLVSIVEEMEKKIDKSK